METEPELFALVDGRRVSRQLCVGHPEVVRRATAAVLDYFEKHPERPWIGLGPDDGRGFCEDDRCRALDGGEWDPYAAETSMTDRYIWLFNRILEGIEDRFPGKRIGFYAYDAYKLPPRRVRPDPRIVPAFAPITLCRLHGLDNPVCPDRSFYKSLMRRWGELVPEIFERGYYFNLADPGFPFSKVHAVRRETPFAHGAGIRGWRVECMPAWAVHTPTLYVAARLMWDVETDVDALLEEFYTAFFGPAAAPMGAYLGSIDRAYRDTDCHAGSSHCLPRVFDADWRGRAARLLAEASGLAEGVHAERVRIFALAHARLEAFLAMLESRDAFDFAAAHEPSATGAGPHRHDARLPPGRERPPAVAAQRPLLPRPLLEPRRGAGPRAHRGAGRAGGPPARGLGLPHRSHRPGREPGLVPGGGDRRQLAAYAHQHRQLERAGPALLQGSGLVPDRGRGARPPGTGGGSTSSSGASTSRRECG